MNRHELDAVSFGFGAVFLTFVMIWLGTRVVDVDVPTGWILASALILLGVVGVVLTLLPYAHRGEPR